MLLQLKNIGIIKNAEIKISGLTVITGVNNSGKSTVGKALFSICNSTENIFKIIFFEKKDYVSRRILMFFQRYFNIEMYYLSLLIERSKLQKIGIIALIMDAMKGFPQVDNEIVFQKQLFFYIDSITNLSIEDISILFQEEFDIVQMNNSSKRKFNSSKFKNNLILLLQELIQYLEIDINNDEFIKRRLLENLNVEFNNQYLNTDSEYGNIELRNNKDLFYQLDLTENGIRNPQPFKKAAFQNVYFIDNPYIIDKWKIQKSSRKISNRNRFHYRDFFENYQDQNVISDILDHTNKIEYLINEADINSFEEIQNSKVSNKILDEMNYLVTGDVFLDNNEYVYSQSKIKLQNLATGLKMFIILKTLIDKGKTDDKSLLIFDEPESHLHPEWQNIFAETIIKLIKYNKCKIVLTTHSPQFLLSSETYSLKYKLDECTNFYNIENLSSNVVINNINNNINKVYNDMYSPFLKVDNLNIELTQKQTVERKNKNAK